MLYEKEEKQLEQESDMNSKQEDTLKVQKTIEALEKKLVDVKREAKQLDYDIQRLQSDGQRGNKLILPRLAEKTLNRMQENKTILPKYGGVNPRYGGIRNIV